MIELIVSIIFIISLGGILYISYKKIPVLTTLPQNGNIGLKEHKIVSNILTKIRKFYSFFEKQIWLHKFLSWIKCLIMKVEVEIDHLLHDLRKKSQEKKK
jgi:hypothetical protein